MAGTLTPIYRIEESLPVQAIFIRYRDRPEKSCREQNNGSVTQLAEYLRGGARAIGASLGKYWPVCCRTTAL